METNTIDFFLSLLDYTWCRYTSSTPHLWTRENPARGQCLVTALLVRDLFGGAIVRGRCANEEHYWNFLPGRRGEADFTSSQYGYGPHTRHVEAATIWATPWRAPADLLLAPQVITEEDIDRLNHDGDLERRYELLKHRYGLACAGLANVVGHFSPRKQGNTALPSAPCDCACHSPNFGSHTKCGTQTNMLHEPCCGGSMVCSS